MKRASISEISQIRRALVWDTGRCGLGSDRNCRRCYFSRSAPSWKYLGMEVDIIWCSVKVDDFNLPIISLIGIFPPYSFGKNFLSISLNSLKLEYSWVRFLNFSFIWLRMKPLIKFNDLCIPITWKPLCLIGSVLYWNNRVLNSFWCNILSKLTSLFFPILYENCGLKTVKCGGLIPLASTTWTTPLIWFCSSSQIIS